MSEIDRHLVTRLIATQFPEWADLAVAPVEAGGWDNRMFHLGSHMVVRLPSAEAYAAQVEKEQRWLPQLAPHLPLPIPTPIGLGKPGFGYLWPWSIHRWLDGARLSSAHVSDHGRLAEDLARFLNALHSVDIKEAPRAGAHNFHRGGPLQVYDEDTRGALKLLANEVDLMIALDLWDEATSTFWASDPVWVHGDVAEGNLLEEGGVLCAVIDFGCMAVGDPACDLVMAWTFFGQAARARFKASLQLDEATWKRGRAWALWKSLITLVQSREGDPSGAARQRAILDRILSDFQTPPAIV
ncbi:aminoglycoside phosphotransferase family protein [Lichenicoccus sp.]|uniref:aminoglycoside phosphotransferase family protein n=1 Tax=Lichenicoccus sp. TaxID=2781899 RepID=UPI003D11ABFB